MKKFIVLVFAVIAGGLVFSVLPSRTSGQNKKFIQASNPIPNRYIVVLNDSVTKVMDQKIAAATDLSSAYGGKVDTVYEQALNGFSAEMDEKEALALSDDPRVKYVEEDGEVFVATQQTGATWGLDRSDHRYLPLTGDYNFNETGAGVNAYVIDTGIRTTHAEFSGRADMVYNAIRDGFNTDCNGHGTHVSGTIGGSTFGIAKSVKLHGVRVLDCSGSGTTSGVISGVDWVTRHGIKPAVANMSLSGGASTSLDDAINSSISSGITYVVAAGNANYDACHFSPSRIPAAITVAASDSSDQSAYFTNWGMCVDIYAPGVNITSAWNTDDYTVNTISGTSMASPHVAGTAALYLENHPSASPAAVSSAIVANGTTSVLQYVYFGSPNVLLYTEFGASPPSCAGNVYSGTIAAIDQVNYHNDANGFSGRKGTYAGTLSSPAGTQFGLALERKKGGRWFQVAATATSNTRVSFDGNSGTYRWRVLGISGTGAYGLCSITP